MNSAKAEDFIHSRLEPLATESKASRIEAGLAFNRSVLIGTLALFIVLAALVFLLPVFSPDQVSNMPRLITFVVFLFGPLGQVVGLYPSFNEAVASIREIQRVARALKNSQLTCGDVSTICETVH